MACFKHTEKICLGHTCVGHTCVAYFLPSSVILVSVSIFFTSTIATFAASTTAQSMRVPNSSTTSNHYVKDHIVAAPRKTSHNKATAASPDQDKQPKIDPWDTNQVYKRQSIHPPLWLGPLWLAVAARHFKSSSDQSVATRHHYKPELNLPSSLIVQTSF